MYRYIPLFNTAHLNYILDLIKIESKMIKKQYIPKIRKR